MSVSDPSPYGRPLDHPGLRQSDAPLDFSLTYTGSSEYLEMKYYLIYSSQPLKPRAGDTQQMGPMEMGGTTIADPLPSPKCPGVGRCGHLSGSPDRDQGDTEPGYRDERTEIWTEEKLEVRGEKVEEAIAPLATVNLICCLPLHPVCFYQCCWGMAALLQTPPDVMTSSEGLLHSVKPPAPDI
ncbi:hypothetical protein Q8A67_024189 [Cirrhinus molitorella]|uniref:Uncharacterized protein n=1 Tax=Cirrhinus molitorella TaxID=172907 RepID=A0AA88NY34_9TELE|nr:hypothetical protein Q8A67_024189 [Cirrhinus molitorella]